LIDKLADVNNQSSVGMFSFYDISHYSCCTVCTRLLVYIICVILSFITYDHTVDCVTKKQAKLFLL